MKYARLSSDSIVIEVFTTPAGFAIEECFHPTIAQQFQECPDEVQANWVLNTDGTYQAPPPPPAIDDPELSDPPATN